MQLLKQSTAVTLKIGPFLDDTDGKTAETALTIAQADVRLSKNGGNIAQKNEATSCTHDELGIYGCPINTTDTGTLGRLQVWVHESGALPVWHEFMVVTANVYDTLCSTDTLQADLVQIGGTAQSATDLKDFADAGYDPATNKVQGVVLCDTTTANTDMVGTNSAALASVCTETRLTELDAANLPTDVSNVKTDTAAILIDTGTDGVLLAATATSAQLIDDVWDEVLTAATHNVATSAGRRVRETAAYTIHGGTAQAGSSTTITLDTGANGGDGVYNRNLVVLTGGTGRGQTRTIVDYTNSTKVCIVDREWRTTPNATTEFQIVADDTPLVVDHGVAQAGTSTTITLRAYASSINDTYLCNIIIIVAGTGRGQARLVGGYVGSTKVVTICGDNWVTTPDTTSVYIMIPYGTACTACMGDTALSEVNAEIVDVMKTDTSAEPAQGAPPATPTLEEMIKYLYFKMRNKTETTSAEDAMYNNAGSTKVMKATISDNGTTFTKEEYGTGA